MTSDQTPPTSGEADLLTLAATAYRSPGLHPVDLIVAARYGFTFDQANIILNTPNLLNQLKSYWRSHAPTAKVIGLAQRGDALGEAHLELLQTAGQVLKVSSRTQYGLAAGTPGVPEILTDRFKEAGTVVTRRIFNDQGVLDIAIESHRIDADRTFPVIALLALQPDELPAITLLFLLIPKEAELGAGAGNISHAESRLQIGPTLTSDRLLILQTPLEATALSGRELGAVSHSVAVAKLPWKDAWRRAAIATPSGHPLREAVIDGLSATG